MDDEPIKLPLALAPKKPYVRPQLHELAGSRADGKAYFNPLEVYSGVGPS